MHAVEPTEAAKTAGSTYAARQLAYKAVVELQAQHVELPNDEPLKLTFWHGGDDRDPPGRRTLMEYLLSPVQRMSSKAGRER